MDGLLFDPETHRRTSQLLGELLARYEADLTTRPVFPEVDRRALRAILDEPLPEEGRPLEELFREFADVILPNSTQVAHPRFLPYVLPSPNGISPYADALASAVNQNCNLWTLSPAANAIEQRVIGWFLELFGFPREGGGILTSGGSMANMTERSLYKAGEALLAVTDVELEQATATLVTAETRGFTVIPRDALAAGSRARLVAYRYPDQILRVSIADLPSAAQTALRAEIIDPALSLITNRDAYAQYIVRPRGDYYVVLNLDGFPRDSVAAPDPATGARDLAPILIRELQAYQLAELENPAQPFRIDFEFANGRSDFRIGERVSFRVRSDRAGYLTLISVEPNGEVIVLYPNELDPENAIGAGEELIWPTQAMNAEVVAQEPTGRGIVRAFVTERPIILPLSVGEAVQGQEIWDALKNAAGRAPARNSDAVPVENWATTAIVYEVRQ